MKKYSLYAKEGTKWTRLTALALKLSDARRVFQTGLLGGTMTGHEMKLRPAEEDFANEAAYKANFERIFKK